MESDPDGGKRVLDISTLIVKICIWNLHNDLPTLRKKNLGLGERAQTVVQSRKVLHHVNLMGSSHQIRAGARNQVRIGLSYRPARPDTRLAEFIP